MTCAVVTGAGGGLGRAIAVRLAAEGHAVAALDINEADLDATRDAVGAAGGSASIFPLDLRDTDAIATTIDRAVAELGPLVVLVNNAAVFPAGPFGDLSPADYDETVEVNQRAYYFAAQAAARHMTVRGEGAIVNVGSITQHGGWSDMVAYVSTKGAAAAFTRALATELGPAGIRVNCVAPGAFPTRAEEMHDDREAYSKRIIDSQALKRRGHQRGAGRSRRVSRRT